MKKVTCQRCGHDCVVQSTSSPDYVKVFCHLKEPNVFRMGKMTKCPVEGVFKVAKPESEVMRHEVSH